MANARVKKLINLIPNRFKWESSHLVLVFKFQIVNNKWRQFLKICHIVKSGLILAKIQVTSGETISEIKGLEQSQLSGRLESKKINIW